MKCTAQWSDGISTGSKDAGCYVLIMQGALSACGPACQDEIDSATSSKPHISLRRSMASVSLPAGLRSAGCALWLLKL